MAKKNENLIARPPVVVIMGHIDCGKTSLLDKIRKTSIQEKESGGITQHIGAYQVKKDEEKITFIDTPGHEAFCQMRSRGAETADIAVLVIDSCKGVQDQTKEVIDCIKKVNIPVIVALNKIDKPAADINRAMVELQQKDILVETFGGKVPSVEVSAKTGKGIPDLLDLILLVAEMEDFKADISKPAKGAVIESYIDNKKGPLATLILKEGILSVGDIIATPSTKGKVKSLEDFQGKKITKIYPSDPALLLGLEGLPMVGEKFEQFKSLEEARGQIKEIEKITIEKTEAQPGQKTLNLIIKTDVIGSIEAVYDILKQIPQEKVILNFLKIEAGNVNENDIKLAKESNAFILGFRVKKTPIAKKLLLKDNMNVVVINFEIIYELVETVRKLMEKTLSLETIRTNFGKMEVLVTFWGKKKRQIIGGKIIDGIIKKGTLIEVTRNDEVIDQGRMINLQRKKKDIEEAKTGEKVGILYEGAKKIEEGDVLVIYSKRKEKGVL